MNDKQFRREKRAQESLLGARTRLPRKIQTRGLYWEQITEKLGITIEGQADELFHNVTLPEGWKIEATDHPMWTRLVDAQGRQRANIFYKGAFYDRSAFMFFETRYYWTQDYDSARPNRIVNVCDRGQSGKVIHEVGRVIRQSDQDYSRESMDREEALGREADAWLKEHYPEYESVFAYW